jgi:hypothetical protein
MTVYEAVLLSTRAVSLQPRITKDAISLRRVLGGHSTLPFTIFFFYISQGFLTVNVGTTTTQSLVTNECCVLWTALNVCSADPEVS